MTSIHQRLLQRISSLSENEKTQLLLQLEEQALPANRRKHPRIPFFTEVTYAQGEKDTAADTREFSRNLSIEGMFIETSEPLQVGQTVYARFSVPGLDDYLHIPATVVRYNADGMGVRFQRPLPPHLKQFFEKAGLHSHRMHFRAYLKTVLKALMPPALLKRCKAQQERLRTRLTPLSRMRHWGPEHFCPICESRIRKFQPRYGSNSHRSGARCPVCYSLERHRLDWLFLKTNTQLMNANSKRLLHVAPEPMLERLFAKLDNLKSVTLDLEERNADIRGDLTALPCLSSSFDAIYCSHVLEHIPDDRMALTELYRVLKCDGWALLQVPVTATATIEDPTITDPVMRAKIFGQPDHLRRYGPDFAERLHVAGFDVRIYNAEDIVHSPDELFRIGIQPNRKIFYCRKHNE